MFELKSEASGETLYAAENQAVGSGSCRPIIQDLIDSIQDELLARLFIQIWPVLIILLIDTSDNYVAVVEG